MRNLRFKSTAEFEAYMAQLRAPGTVATDRSSRRGPKELGTQPARTPSKYRNAKVIDSDGLTHDSRKEYNRWCVLQLRARAGEIQDLRRQPVFDLYVNGVLVCKYVGDAGYTENGRPVVEDTKSEITRKNRAYRIKAKLFRAIYGFDITEV